MQNDTKPSSSYEIHLKPVSKWDFLLSQMNWRKSVHILINNPMYFSLGSYRKLSRFRFGSTVSGCCDCCFILLSDTWHHWDWSWEVTVTPSESHFSCSVLSDSLWPHGLQHGRLPCPPPTPGVSSNLCPSSQWYHPTISSFVFPFSCPQSFLTSGFFQWVGSSHQVAKVLEFQINISPPNEYSGLIFFRMAWLDLLAVQGTLKSSPTPHWKASILHQ